MAHLTLIEDKDGQLGDAEVYCSDYCAKSSEHYAGWYGCAEISFAEPCKSCGENVPGLDEL